MPDDLLHTPPRRLKTGMQVLLVALGTLVFALFALFETKHTRTLPPVLEVDLTEPCRENPWIGVLKAGVAACPAGWDPLFAISPDRAAGQYRTAVSEDDVRHPENGELPPGLGRFCMIADPKKPKSRKLDRASAREALPSHEVFERIDQDCSVIGGADDTMFPIPGFDQPLTARFRQAAGKPDSAFTRSLEGSPDSVRLVIVDSAPDVPDLTEEELNNQECRPAPANGHLECSAHGWAMGKLARDLLCPGGNCVTKIRTRRALRGTYEIQKRGSILSSVKPKRVKLSVTGSATGGRFGDQKDLALAIWREVDVWRQEPNRPKLILNLSVGWEGIYGDAPFVRAAIEDAVCRGALVIAAAGNRIAGPEQIAETPVLPGAWEQVPAPSQSQCRELLGFTAPQGSEAYRPLVHAVGGVQCDDRPMSNSRPQSTPRMVAYGDHVPVLYSSGARRETLTGTSVSTLVVAAAAAVQWRKDIDQESFAVMAALWDSGKPVSQPVDFCLGSPCPAARRVSVGLRRESPGCWPKGRPVIEKPDTIPLGDFPRLKTLWHCTPQTLRYGGKLPGGANLCPQRWALDIAAQAMVVPQPGSNHNPNCTVEMSSPGTLLLEFHPRFRVGGMPAELSDLTLIAGDQAFRLPKEAFMLGEPGSGPKRLVLDELVFDGEPPYPLYLAATVNGEYATITPILLVAGPDESEVASSKQRDASLNRPARIGN